MVESSVSMERAARNFLRTGKTGRHEPQLLAEACDRLVRAETQKSLPQAVQMARKFVAEVRHQPRMPLQLALRSLGWACQASGKYSMAEKAYLEARDLVNRVPGIRARIDRILIDTYMYKGEFPEAKRRAYLAMNTFRRLREMEEVAKTRINYGNLFHRQDRHKEAKKQYEEQAG